MRHEVYYGRITDKTSAGLGLLFLPPPRWAPLVRYRRDMTMDEEIQEYKLTLTDKTLARCLDDVKGSWKREIVTRALVSYERERDSKIAYS